MGGQGSGRKPSPETIVRRYTEASKPSSTVSNGLVLPNLSGDHSKGSVTLTPSNDTSIVNKKYVDDSIITDHGALTGLGDDDHTQYLLRNDFTDQSVLFSVGSDISEDNSYLYYDDSAKVLTVVGDVKILADNKKLLLGAAGDASIYYSGSHMYFNSQEVGSGDFIFSNGMVGINKTPSYSLDVANYARFDYPISVGTTPLNSTAITADITYTATSGSYIGQRLYLRSNPTGNSTAAIYGLAMYPILEATSYNANGLIGAFVQPQINHTAGTLTTVRGVFVYPYLSDTSAGTTTTMSNMYLGNPNKHASSTETIGTMHQLYIENPTRATTNYSIYSAGGYNFFAGASWFGADVWYQNTGSGIPYGHMYAKNTTIVNSVASANVAYEVTAGITGGNTNLVTFANTHELVVTKAGKYQVTYNISAETSTAGDEIECGIMVAGTEATTDGGAHAEIVTANKSVNLSGSCIVSCTASQGISLYVRNHTSGRDITIEHLNVSVIQVGG